MQFFVINKTEITFQRIPVVLAHAYVFTVISELKHDIIFFTGTSKTFTHEELVSLKYILLHPEKKEAIRGKNKKNQGQL